MQNDTRRYRKLLNIFVAGGWAAYLGGIFAGLIVQFKNISDKWVVIFCIPVATGCLILAILLPYKKMSQMPYSNQLARWMYIVLVQCLMASTLAAAAWVVLTVFFF